MNKAFCKEPDDSRPPQCPRCGNEGVRVEPATLAAHVTAAASERLGEPAYFDLLERTVAAGDARGLPWPKDPDGPLCACFGLTADDIDADIAEGVPTRIREVVRKAALPDAACGTRSADGRSCVARVQRAYVRRKAALGGG